MDCEKRIKELEAELKRLRGASSQWAVIQKLLEESNRKLKETEEKLKVALVKAEAATKAKSQFLANMSHEIRTPLNGIVGMADILKITPLTDEQREYLNIIMSSSESLLQIINDILDFSKIEAGKIELETIKLSLEDIISNVANILIIKTEKKGIELITYIDPNVPQYLMGDPVRIQQIILNLANNAVKFTHKGEVCIGVKALEINEQSANIRFEVRDTGIGISKENQKKLFKSFSQADTSTTRKFGGTGLGLAISKKLVEQMGGTIGVESEEGKGATFYFNIIVGRYKSDGVNKKPVTKAVARDTRILAVDDNQTNVKILSKYLEFGGYDKLVFDQPENVIDALLKAKKEGNPFQIALLDYHMPNIDGIMLARMIKEEREIKDTKLILLSSLAATNIEEDDLRRLFVATLTKPVKYQSLMNVIEDVTGQTTKNNKIHHMQKQHKILDIKALVVDDNVINIKVATTIISRFIKNIDTAKDGEEALEKALSNNYDLIFMDVVMPKMDGIVATKKIREAGNKTMIIAMTANALKDDIDLCLKSGMNDYISKPYKIEEIEEVIYKHFNEK
jgi:signal transduction histidine kinase/CheY-like chemotaxis protein